MRLALCALVACSPAHDLPDADPCAPPAIGADWLPGLVGDAVTQLARAPRFTTSERDTARNYLAAQLPGAQVQAFPTGSNVYAQFPSTTGSAQLIVVGAHFDTVSGSPGADDNASGVAAVLAIARYLRDTPCRGPNVDVVLFDEEEPGLFGSRAFAASLAGTEVTAVHTVDQVGWDADADRRFELELPTAALEAEYRAAAATLGVPVTVTMTNGTDHQSFRDPGFPAIGLTEGYTTGDTSPYRHTPMDTVADVDYLVVAAQLLGQVVLTEVVP